MRDEKEISSQIESNADKLFGKDWRTRLAYSAGYMDGIAYADNHPNWEEIVERMRKEITNDLRSDRWISVKEELPKINPNDSEWEYSDDVIVALKDGSIAVGRYERDNSTGEHYWMLYGVDKDLIATHWMHSPRLPKKGGEND